MTDKTATIIFASYWWVLIGIAIVASILFEGRPYRRRAGAVMNMLVITPFVLVFGLFYLGPYLGGYAAGTVDRIGGAVVMASGLVGYVVSHFYLRANWSLGASVREGHKLVIGGPYRFVRHPMYSSMMLVVLGSGLLVGNYLMIASTIAVGVVYYVRARKEEDLLKRELPEYREYARKTKMLLPWLL